MIGGEPAFAPCKLAKVRRIGLVKGCKQILFELCRILLSRLALRTCFDTGSCLLAGNSWVARISAAHISGVSSAANCNAGCCGWSCGILCCAGADRHHLLLPPPPGTVLCPFFGACGVSHTGDTPSFQAVSSAEAPAPCLGFLLGRLSSEALMVQLE